MNKYESVIIINPNLEDAPRKELITKIETLINDNGKVTKIDEMGKKKLAYEIQKCKEAFYVVFYFEAEASFISELERHFRITEDILKFMTVKKDN